MKLHVEVRNRADTAPLSLHGVNSMDAIKVNSYSQQAIGGPYRAELSLSGGKYTLMNYIGTLRCPVKIYDELERCVWWGYIHEIRMKYGSVNVGVSLDDMYNRITVKYSLVTPGTFTPPQDTVTAVANNTDSIAEYGYKEQVYSYHECSTEEAESVRDTTLAKKKYPQPMVSLANPRETDSVTFYCRGWWETLGWLYYSNPEGLISYTKGGGGKATVGDATENVLVEQWFTTSPAGLTIGKVKLNCCKSGAPGDLFTIAIEDNALVYGYKNDIAPADLPTEQLDWREWPLTAGPGGLTLAGSTAYRVILGRTGGLDANNYYWCGLDTGFAPPTNFKEWDSGLATWVTRPKGADGKMLFQITDSIESIQQIDTIITAASQFHSAIIWDTPATGIFSCQFRMGDRTALEEVLDLLKAGTTNDRRMLAQWDAAGNIHLLEEPTDTVYTYKKNGDLAYLNGALVEKHLCPVGQWMRVEETIDWGADFMADPANIFIEEAEYNVAGNTLSITSRDAPNPMDRIILAEPQV